MTNPQGASARQEWLTSACAAIIPIFADAHKPEPPANCRVNFGFPSRGATSTKSKRIGECWSPEATPDAVNEIFIHPILALDHAPELRILETLVHELVHAAVGIKCKHRGPFKAVALAIGLEGKMTSTSAGIELRAKLQTIANGLGPFPTSGLDASKAPTKKQTTRLLKCECAACGYIARVSSKHLSETGSPICPCNGEPMSNPLETETPTDPDSESEDN